MESSIQSTRKTVFSDRAIVVGPRCLGTRTAQMWENNRGGGKIWLIGWTERSQKKKGDESVLKANCSILTWKSLRVKITRGEGGYGADICFLRGWSGARNTE